ncbi:MAG: AbrB/MazE/SpoVT family DNA-binding domain-containing protein [Acidimicrobiia bacterium]|nr:AbrB/MazE/SpoVT family DNA-binding domain-containing protein [Acidimicrobiia bacterium]MDH4309445.1 AbrB/MazE/SpoVT family DNA-binding domain-containing protein [Acidimicrobiia bacterium]
METAIDRAGRVVIPKAIRDRLHLVGGEQLDIEEHDGVIEIRPAPMDVDIVDTPDGPVVKSKRQIDPLTDDDVRAALDSIRR